MQIVKYKTSVLVPAGWRDVIITAMVEQTSPKMAVVKDVVEIDGRPAAGYMSRGGGSSHRQRFHAGGVAQREIGKRKRLSACWEVE